jgi:hypothetical protein
MMDKENRTATVSARTTAVKAKPRPATDEIIEEILRAAGLEALD